MDEAILTPAGGGEGGMTRKMAISAARVAGYHDNQKEFVRLLVESRVAQKFIKAAFRVGKAAKAAGVPCFCSSCCPKKEAA